MTRIICNRTFVVGTLAAVALAVGAAALSRANSNARQTIIPATYHVNSAPTVTPAEAARAVASAKDLSTAFRVASDKVLPSVVTVENRPQPMRAGENRPAPGPGNPFGDRNPFEGTPFEDFFRDRGFQFEMPSPRRQPPQRGGAGSGVVIDRSGIILTNNHVVRGGGEVTVRLHDGREFEATNVWTDPKTDLAVVQIDANDLVAAKLGDSDTVSVGDWVLALGQPFGLESTVTAGIISAKHRGIGITARENFLQTDAAINPGNSGGPLVNLDGELIGINTAISSRTGGNDGIGFAIPINLAKWVANQLKDEGVVRRAYLGVGIQPVTAALANELNVKPRQGVVVTNVIANTPAAKAGLKTGDVIVQYAGVAVSSPNELQLLVERSELGRAHGLTVIRDGRQMNLRFTPEEQPNDFGVAPRMRESLPRSESSQVDKLGLEVTTLDKNVAERLGLDEAQGVVITNVEPNSPARLAGLSAGMVITQVNRRPVTSGEMFAQAIERSDPDNGLLLLVRGPQGARFVVIK